MIHNAVRPSAEGATQAKHSTKVTSRNGDTYFFPYR